MQSLSRLKALFVALHLETLGKKKPWFVSNYLMFLAFVVCIQVMVGSISFFAILHFLELVYPLLTFVIAYYMG